MSSLSDPKQEVKKTAPHEGEAIAFWGLIVGAMAGGIVGMFLEIALVTGIAGAVAGWLVGALIERARR
jgi:uncharacterized protein YcfJ